MPLPHRAGFTAACDNLQMGADPTYAAMTQAEEGPIHLVNFQPAILPSTAGGKQLGTVLPDQYQQLLRLRLRINIPVLWENLIQEWGWERV